MRMTDCHAHTTASDGLHSPTEVVRIARDAGLYAVAVTDHDSVDGVEEALEAGKRWGMEVIPGVEISTLWQGREIHMLGLFIDHKDPGLLEKLEELRDVRRRRNLMMIDKLNELGIDLTLEEVEAKKRGKADLNVGRPHIAEVLMEKGIVRSMEEAFDKYLGKNGLAYVTPDRISPVEAIRLIHRSKGAAVIAHPGLYGMDEILPWLVENGLDGIEVNHPDHTEEDKARYLRLAEQWNLAVTAGSDFHGERNGSMYHAPLGTCRLEWERALLLKERAEKNREG
ncbi:PHP domain-containing protein [Staphylospora marina]|uniref:PHP domain-containing protein n=1 Tax=Staphylospora marina TaxID=2490858 RepID=UPI0019CF9A34|nr:PHP domain-containing protein [Staphylospora marina]